MERVVNRDRLREITNKAMEYANKCQQFSPNSVEYRFFTDSVKELSGASFVGLYLVSEKHKGIATIKAFSGDRDLEASDDLYAMEFDYQGEFLGRVTLVMPNDKTMEYEGLIKLYINQIAGTIKRLRAEKRLLLNVKALQESEAKARAYIEKSPLGIFVVDNQGHYIEVNQAACQMTGYSEAELLNISIQDFLTPEFLEKGLETFKRLQTKGSAEDELMVRKKNGTTFWINLTAVVIDQNNVISFCKDITERKEKEERTKELNFLYGFSRLLLNKGNDLDKILEETVKILPAAFQYPQDASVYISFLGREFKTQNFKSTPWKISAQLELYGELTGAIEVYYLKPPLPDRDSFIKEEILSLETVAGHLSRVTEQIQDQASLKHQFRFEKMLADISNVFASQPSERLEQSINYALAQIGAFFQVDSSYVIRFSDDGRRMTNMYEWCAEGIEAQKGKTQDMPVDTFPWFVTQIKEKKHVIVSDVDLLPPEAEAEKEKFKSQSIQSLISLPLMKNGIVFGYLGLDAVREQKVWTENLIAPLTVAAELVSNAYTRNLVEEKVRYQSFRDGLTGLYNRVYLEREMERLDTKRQLPIGVIMADLNGLKLANDTFGHDVGDEMLKRTAEILGNSCRREEIIARWGGDEFVIFLPQTTEDQAKTIYKRIEEKCKETYIKDIPLSLAVGTAIKSKTSEDLAEILKEAEANMYKHKLEESQQAKSAGLKIMLEKLEAKSFESDVHYAGMQNAAERIGKNIGLSQSKRSKLNVLISLHDIGEINISKEILTKNGPLTDEEWDIIKKHPETGYRIVRATEEFTQVAEEILSHHEHWDGSGYPQGLHGKDIPLLARITSIADAYEVMSSGRPYKKKMSESKVLAELKQCAGSQFDPELIDIFLPLFRTEKTSNQS